MPEASVSVGVKADMVWSYPDFPAASTLSLARMMTPSADAVGRMSPPTSAPVAISDFTFLDKKTMSREIVLPVPFLWRFKPSYILPMLCFFQMFISCRSMTCITFAICDFLPCSNPLCFSVRCGSLLLIAFPVSPVNFRRTVR